MERRLILLPFLVLLLSACAQNGFQEPLATVNEAPAITTYSPPTLIQKLIGAHQVVDGASQISNLKLNINGPKAGATLKGTVTFQPASGSSVSVPFDVSGTIGSEDYTSYMNATNQAQMDGMGLRVGAKLTCLYTDCSESFIDIYINYKGIIYHHQVEAKGNEVHHAADIEKSAPSTLKTPKVEEDGARFEHDIDEDNEAGAYVGEPQKDLEVLFPNLTDKKSTPDEKRPNPPPSKNAGGSSIVKIVLKGLGQAVTSLGKNNFVRGHLENPANILSYEEANPRAGFHIIYPKRQNYYGTDDMLAVLANMGRYSQDKLKGYVLSIGDISAKKGGPLGRHSSHQMGLDADIAYYFNANEKQKGLIDAVASSGPIPSFMADEQFEMFKVLVSQGNVDRIFIHPTLKKELCSVAIKKGELKPDETQGSAFEALRVMRPEVHHRDHFHLRLKCSTAQPRCRQMALLAKQTGCN